MTTRICASSLIVAAAVAASGSAIAQQPYPDLKGAWTGQTRPSAKVRRNIPTRGDRAGLRRGPLDPGHRPARGEPVHGHAGTDGRHAARPAPRRDPGRPKTIHMVDDDGTFLGILTGPDALEVCRSEVTAVSRNVSCSEFTRSQ